MVIDFGRLWTRARLAQWYLRAFARNGVRRLVRHRSRRRQVRARVRGFPRQAEQLLGDFREPQVAPSADAYERLALYFAQGWKVFRTEHGEGAMYPGLPNHSGHRVQELEGFARIMPLFGAWVASGRPARVSLPDGAELDLVEEFRRGLVAGTDPASPAYWGAIERRFGQRIVEAADIALALWLFRDTAWPMLSPREQQAVVEWLCGVNEREVLDNNWHLFVVIVDRVLHALGHPVARSTARDHHERIKHFHVGDGWFRDGPAGFVDFYNAWGFHYLLHWIDRIDPAWDPEYVREVQRSFLATYRYLVGPNGVPILGRSVCYRMAVPAPLVFGQRRHPDVVTPGEARRALDCVWQHFIRRGAVRLGNVTQGYCGDPDPRILDYYSGPASCLWSLRSLIAALDMPRGDPFWAAAPEPLPVERGDFRVQLDGAGWVVTGKREGAVITIEIPANAARDRVRLEPYGLRERFLGVTEDRPMRPRNNEAKFRQRIYRSDRPFCGCS